MFDSTARKPVVGEEGKNEAEHVFEHEQTCKCLDSNFTYQHQSVI
jgi:hypothetical protein